MRMTTYLLFHVCIDYTSTSCHLRPIYTMDLCIPGTSRIVQGRYRRCRREEQVLPVDLDPREAE